MRRAYESARKIQRLLNKLPTLPDDKRLSAEDAKSIFWALWGQVDEEVKLEEISIPSVPETIELETLEEYDVSWTVSLVREGIAAIASSAGEEVEKLLDVAIEESPRQVRWAKSKVEKVEQNLKNMSRERLLPDEKTLEKIARYEAHLSRQLYQAMHELEALRTKRSGGAAPLARLDVQGLES